MFKCAKVLFASLLCGLSLLTAGQAGAQSFPSRPITIIVPYGPGSGNDVIARELAQKLTDIMGTSVVVENKAGATGNIATDYVAQAKPDGYTVLLTSTSGIINQITSNVRTDMPKDFDPVGFAGMLPYVLAVHPSFPANTVAELVALAKKEPGKLNFNGPVGSMSDFLGSVLMSTAGVDLVMVPYKSTSDAQVDVLAGRIELWFTTAASALSLAKAGRVKVLAVTAEKRLQVLPDVPTVREAGYPALTAEVAFFVLAPAGTPKDVLTKFNEAVGAALRTKAVEERLATQGVQMKIGTSEEVRAYIRSELEKWRGVIKKEKS